MADLPSRRRWPLILGVSGAAVLGLLVLLGGAAWWLWRSEAGFSWLLQQVPGLELRGREGRPDGGPFRAESLVWRGAGFSVEVDGLAWRDLGWRWRPHERAWLRIEIDAPQARRVQVRTEPGPEPAPERGGAPSSLVLPLELVLHRLAVQALRVNQQPPLQGLAGELHLGDEQGRLHRIGPLVAQRAPAALSLQAQVGAVGDLRVSGRLQAISLAGAPVPWRAEAVLGGTVPRPTVEARLAAGAGGAAGRADLQATLAPFAAWPLLALQAQAQALDLAALRAGWPVTRLGGRAVVTSTGAEQPATAELALRNEAAGPWSAQRLPVQAVQATLRARPARPDALEARIETLQLHGHGDAGRLSGEGRWVGEELSLDLLLQALQPARLDERLAAMHLGGPLRLRLSGLGLPWAAGAAPASAAPALSGTVGAELAGRLGRVDGRPGEPLRIALAAAFERPAAGRLQVALEPLRVQAAGSSVALEGRVRRDAAANWAATVAGRFERVDPSQWWAGAPGSAWRRGRHALAGQLTADLRWPAAAPGAEPQGWHALLRHLRGEARVDIAPSRLAGLPLEGELRLAGGESATRVEARLQAAGNRAEGRLEAADAATRDRWHLQADAPALARLAPIGRLLPVLEAWWPRQGSLQAEADAAGAWPVLTTEGRMQARALVLGPPPSGTARGAGDGPAPGAAAERVDLRWQATPGRPAAPLSLVLDARGLRQGGRRIETLSARVDGTLAAHRFELQAASPVRPPAWTDALLSGGGAPPRGTALALAGEGRRNPLADGAVRWLWQLSTLRLGPRGGGAPWLQAGGLEAALRLAPDGSVAAAELAPGRLRLREAVLQWHEALWQAGAGGAPPRVRLAAELEPLAVVPWLQAWRPDLGWQGDLRVGATLRVHGAGTLEADAVVQRTAGDLAVQVDGVRRTLGLSALRFALSAQGGTWRLRQQVAGAQIGSIEGTQTVRAAPGAPWPGAQAPVEGTLEVRSAGLDTFGAWLPPGWRIQGRLEGRVAIGGRVGAPTLQGRVLGRGLEAHNPLLGVQVQDGQLALDFDGDSARLRSLTLQAGEGTLQASGSADWSGEPSARLQLQARQFQALSRQDRRVVVSGQAEARFGQRLSLRGRITVDRGYIDIAALDAPSLDEDVVVIRRTAAGGTGPVPAARTPVRAGQPPAGPLAQADLRLVIDLGDDLRLVGRGLETELHGQLTVTTDDGALAAHGAVRTVGGTYAAYGQNLVIERGVLYFSGEPANPRLDILALRPDIDVTVGVSIQGLATSPRVRLYSRPPMSDMEKLSWLVMGRAPAGLGRDDTALLQRAALALLAGEGAGRSPGLLQRLGLDELSLRRGESGDLAGTVVSLGKQLSERLFIGYERGLNAAAGSWHLLYRIARRLTLRLQAGEESAVEAVYTWRWN